MHRYFGMAGQKALKRPTAKRDTEKGIIVSFSRARLIENKDGSHWTPGSSNENYEKQPRDAATNPGPCCGSSSLRRKPYTLSPGKSQGVSMQAERYIPSSVSWVLGLQLASLDVETQLLYFDFPEGDRPPHLISMGLPCHFTKEGRLHGSARNPRLTFQTLSPASTGDPKAFPGKQRDMVLPSCPGSSRGLLPLRKAKNTWPGFTENGPKGGQRGIARLV
ncbi:uncharacterized protein isoform X9 [Danio rerio]|uniref:Uncharacterized protein isoform X9 n=2 Tax=Danio rerio TaxID=7955 RepID=A0AC58I0T1_DANRE